MNLPAYEQFIRSKIVSAPARGLEILPDEVHPWLKPHAQAIVRWAIHRGNAAIFAAFGLHKTSMQLEIARIISKAAGGKFLIVAPLGVSQEFKRDAEKLGTEIKFVRRLEQCRGDGIYLTNYETVRDSKLDPRSRNLCARCLKVARLVMRARRGQ